MNEYSFTLYHQSGVPVTFNVTPSAEMLYDISNTISNALTKGWLVSEPKPGEGEKVIRICGYVVGEYQDKGGSFEPCLWLYADDQREFKIGTIYPEHFDKLPFKVGKTEWDGAAPEATTARLKGKLHPWKAEVIQAPRMKDGEMLLNDDGKPVYKFVGIKTSEQPTAELVQTIRENQTQQQQTNGHGSEQKPYQQVERTSAINVTTSPCPECHAPPGNKHGTHCSKRTVVR